VGKIDPPRAGNHSVDGPATVAYPDPFPAYPPEPYGSARPRVPDESEPPTDPEFPALDTSPEDFDPFTVGTYRPDSRWYHSRTATIALATIGVAVVAILIASVLLVSGKWTIGETPPTHTSPEPTSSAAPTATTPLTSPPPPLPPPPTESPAPAYPQDTYAPVYPRRTEDTRRNVTTPETRPPDISVRPTHRTAFPGQPGAN
jgi:hypothetical protein